METIRLGKIVNYFGLKGEVKVISMTDFPKERFRLRAKLSLFNEQSNDRVEVTVKSFRDQGNVYVIGFEEIPSINEAEKYVNYFIEVEKDKAPLPEGYVRLQDLLGCQVQDDQGKVLGKVIDILTYSPTKTLKVEREGNKPFYVPFVDEFIKAVDVANKIIVINVIEGLL
jgi:16S rRNA processing protein RimM